MTDDAGAQDAHLIGLDAHNLAAFENAFRCPVDHLEAVPMRARHLGQALGPEPVTVVSPDFGGAKRAQRLQDLLAIHAQRDIGFALHEKRRSSGVVSGDLLVGPVAGCRVVIFDDLVSGGSTILRAVQACREAGASRVDACATHGVFLPEARRLLGPEGPDQLIVTDSILPTRLVVAAGQRAPVVLPASGLFAEAVRRIVSGGSVVALRALEPAKG